MIFKLDLVFGMFLGSMCFAQDASPDKELPVALDEIYVEKESLFINIEGKPCAIRSLKKKGNIWMATTMSSGQERDFFQKTVWEVRCPTCGKIYDRDNQSKTCPSHGWNVYQ